MGLAPAWVSGRVGDWSGCHLGGLAWSRLPALVAIWGPGTAAQASAGSGPAPTPPRIWNVSSAESLMQGLGF